MNLFSLFFRLYFCCNFFYLWSFIINSNPELYMNFVWGFSNYLLLLPIYGKCESYEFCVNIKSLLLLYNFMLFHGIHGTFYLMMENEGIYLNILCKVYQIIWHEGYYELSQSSSVFLYIIFIINMKWKWCKSSD